MREKRWWAKYAPESLVGPMFSGGLGELRGWVSWGERSGYQDVAIWQGPR